MKRITFAVVTAIGIAAVLSTGCNMYYGLMGKKGAADVDVVLRMKDGICQVYEKVDDLGGDKDKKITWRVKNKDCQVPQYVTITEYHERLPNGTLDPNVDHDVVNPDLVSTGRLQVNDKETVGGKISKTLRKPATDKVFKYKICTGPFVNPTLTCLDPDLDVWPF